MRRCRAALEAAWGAFRERWAALHPLNRPRRAQALQLLQPLAELQVCVCLMRTLACWM